MLFFTFKDAQEMLKADPHMSYHNQIYRAAAISAFFVYRLHRLRTTSPVMYSLAKAFADEYPSKTLAELFSLPDKPPTLDDSLQAIIDYWLARPDYRS